MSNPRSIPCDIALVPSPDIAEKAIVLSERLAKQGSLFTLNNSIGPFPHASLYMTQLRVSDLGTVKSALSEIASNFKSPEMIATSYYQALGFIDANYDRGSSVIDLQTRVIAAVNPLRDGMREKDKARMLDATGADLDNFNKFGYRFVGELFRPHLTLTRMVENDPIDTTMLPNPIELSGRFTGLAIFQMGDNGTCIREIARFDFANR